MHLFRLNLASQAGGGKRDEIQEVEGCGWCGGMF